MNYVVILAAAFVTASGILRAAADDSATQQSAVKPGAEGILCPDCFVECEPGFRQPCGCCTPDCCAPEVPTKPILCPACFVKCEPGFHQPCGCCTPDCCMPNVPPKTCPKGCYKKYTGDRYECDCCHRDGGVPNPCDTAKCTANTTCQAVISKCENDLAAPCNLKPHAQCIQNCPEGNDRLRCKRGQHLMFDIKGCKDCYTYKDFVNPCNAKGVCKEGDQCVLQQVLCKKKLCHPEAQCRPICPAEPRSCPKNCLKVIGPNGCKFCMCCNACVNHKCPKGEECTLESMMCIRQPCAVMARCRKPSSKEE